MIKQLNRFLFFVFVFGCFASANFLKASSEEPALIKVEESFPHITAETVDQIPVGGGVFTFDAKKLVNLNELPKLFFALGNDGVIPHYDGKNNVMLDLGTLQIFAKFHPAQGFKPSIQQSTTVFIPGSGGMLKSEEKEVQRLVAGGENVFTLMVNYSYENEKNIVKLSDPEPKEVRIRKPLEANPLRQVSAAMHLMKLIEELPFVGDLTLQGRSFGAVSALLAAQQEFSGPLTPGAILVKDINGRFDYDIWAGVPKFTVKASSPLLPIMPLSPHFSGKIIIFAGSQDTYCNIQSVVYALQKSMGTNIVLEILEGAGHFPESDHDEYMELAKTIDSVTYRPDFEDFLFEKDKNLSGTCFKLEQKVSFFTMDQKKTNEEMGRLSQASFSHHGISPWEEGEQCSFFNPRDINKLIDALEPGTTIKPDSVVKDYIQHRTNQLKSLSDSEFIRLAADQCNSLRKVKTEEDMKNYVGFVTKEEMLKVSKAMSRDETGNDDPIR